MVALVATSSTELLGDRQFRCCSPRGIFDGCSTIPKQFTQRLTVEYERASCPQKGSNPHEWSLKEFQVSNEI